MTNADDGSNPLVPVDPTKEILQKLNPTLRPEKRADAERVIATFVQKLHVGPLPAPEDLAHYDAVCPGAAQRIIAMAETQATHRQSIESNHLRWEYGLQSRGQWFALAALVAMLILIGFTFYIGQPIAASILGGATIVAVVGMFLNRDRGEEPVPAPRPQQQGKRKRRR